MKSRILLFVFLFLMLGFAQTEVNAQASIETKTDAQQIVLGDQVRFFITASLDTNNGQLKWASFPDTFNSLELIEKGKIDTSWQGSVVQYKQRLLLTGFDSGDFLIPRFSFLVLKKAAIIDTLFSDSFRIKVNTISVDTSKPFKEIKNIALVKFSWVDYIPSIIGSLIGIGLLVWIILYFLKRKKQAQKEKVPEKLETFQELTLRKLRELDEKELWQKDKVKDYYTELSEIIRHYIEVRFKTPAMELTTDELLQKAKKHREMAPFRTSLKPLLEAADLAKFAKAAPLPEEHIEAMKLANTFVVVSKPKEIINNNNPQNPIK
jgi:hypothetical protein